MKNEHTTGRRDKSRNPGTGKLLTPLMASLLNKFSKFRLPPLLAEWVTGGGKGTRPKKSRQAANRGRAKNEQERRASRVRMAKKLMKVRIERGQDPRTGRKRKGGG